ncbi:uncharacterized protein TNIN_161051 [Trichonephila inaurata madagascariensis]|uniref:Uncharacterized protein n=1 Tax=Trichonephila inaurata madagascariensis TaxID=2747483 RepID=A0A8X6XBL7_9ARAC|nr:uncharacterized protein TNIN_161051 [Trichonephila inaurata madagascariensis]
MLTLTVIAVSFLLLATAASSDTLLNMPATEVGIKTIPSEEKENVFDESVITSNLIEKPEGINSKIFKSNTAKKVCHIYVYIKGTTKSKEGVSVPLKFKIIESSDEELPAEGRKVLSPPEINHKLTPLTTSLFTRNRPNLLDSSPFGLGSGILGIGAFDLGHGLGHFGLR